MARLANGNGLKLKIGRPAPDFKGRTDTGEQVTLDKYKGKKLVLYFYPKDNTPGCARESCSFSEGFTQIRRKGGTVLGVSTDSVASHQKFRQRYSFKFPLLSDPEREVVQAYGVWKEKSLYGQKYMGIERTTVIINEQGKIQKVFLKVKVEGHFEEVLAAL
ncbi:MAG: peroxiredoxin [Candidatus Omnitrophica bacterium CG11_big_fil_rev_8_21_14_0_20_64_10]|nr:MAG: peroxiredoxin [Candidatus Omnitrophica bacterium CG11_big_fil_rev_8_21_14_0_20_64_10]